jgi:hypothetical protein
MAYGNVLVISKIMLQLKNVMISDKIEKKQTHMEKA